MMDPVLREIRDLTEIPGSNVDCVVLVSLANEKDEKVRKKVPDIQGSMSRSLAAQVDTIAYLQPGAMGQDGVAVRELVVDARKGIEAGDRTKVLRRGFHGSIDIEIDDDTDEPELEPHRADGLPQRLLRRGGRG
jgi:hypothetical protein